MVEANYNDGQWTRKDERVTSSSAAEVVWSLLIASSSWRCVAVWTRSDVKTGLRYETVTIVSLCAQDSETAICTFIVTK